MLLAATLLLAAHAAEPPASARQRAPRGRECVAVLVASPQQKRPPRRLVFSATEVLDLEFRTLLKGRPEGPRTLEVKLYTPRGHLYQVLTVPFSAPDGRSPRKRQVEGFPQPMTEQAAKPVRFGGLRPYSVSTLLPVAGTTIMVDSLYGQWKAEPHLDGRPEPCGPARKFVIDQ